ncbi:MAG TPA: hypothetical protein VFU47_13320, partial [Armatimonadota bacterium]|nr:hypothetical protein [Armatimonadota bacterium]
SGDRWVVDGNYSVVRDLVWGRADTVVWLDYPFPVTFSRLLRRTTCRILSKEELWNGNRESLRTALSRNSILVWALCTYWRRKQRFPLELARPEYAHLRLHRHRRPSETARWLEQVPAPPDETGKMDRCGENDPQSAATDRLQPRTGNQPSL